ncbi:hypothetical protein ACIRVF_08025 [Kitasatospora sp. NPDC101157]|uniref:hypothetical protein n=1 Tax=Kitasatospora sp. NPDC101157 TaxID=3364098 RepID=UPI0038274C96
MTPTAEQLDHLIGHTDHRPLTADEHAALRAGVRQLRDLAGRLALAYVADASTSEQAEARMAAIRAHDALKAAGPVPPPAANAKANANTTTHYGAPSSAYHQQVVKQLATAEDELGKRRTQVARLTEQLAETQQRADRYEQAYDFEAANTAVVFHEYYRRWQSTIVEARRQAARADRILAAAKRGCDDLGAMAHDALNRAEQAEARVAAVRELHQPRDHGGWIICTGCSKLGHVTAPWPCPTVAALDEAADSVPDEARL